MPMSSATSAGRSKSLSIRQTMDLSGTNGNDWNIPLSMPANDPYALLRDVSSGTLGRPLPLGSLAVPTRVEIHNDHLRFMVEPLTSRAVTPTLLDQFVALSSDEAILAFARQWGVLALCHHGLPFQHEGADGRCERLLFRRSWVSEPLGVWNAYIGAVASALRMKATIDRGATVSLSDVTKVSLLALLQIQVPAAQRRGRQVSLSTRLRARRGHGAPRRTPAPLQSESELDRRHLEHFINSLLFLGGVRPRIRFQEKRTRMELFGAGSRLGGDVGLLGAVAVQLLHAVAGTRAVEVCSACGRPFLPARRRAQSRDRYCPSCRDGGASMRAAKWRYRSKLRQAIERRD
jgi:hypothetical protein